MRILITGGTGLIGRALCKALQLQGHQLTVLSRNPSSVAQKCGAGNLPICAISALSELTPETGFDAIINLAGEPIVDAAWSESRKKQLWDSRVTLTKKLIQYIVAAHHKPAVLLSGSAIGYYGDRGDEALSESASPGGDFAAQLCIAWEHQAEQAATMGVRICILRTGLVLAKQGGLIERMVLPFKLGLGARLGSGNQWMSWIHIDDYVAAVVRLLLDTNADGAYNMTAPQPVTNRIFTAELARAVRRPAWFVVPAFFLNAVLGSRAVLVLGGQKVLPSKLLMSDFQYRYPNLSSALQEIV